MGTLPLRLLDLEAMSSTTGIVLWAMIIFLILLAFVVISFFNNQIKSIKSDQQLKDTVNVKPRGF